MRHSVFIVGNAGTGKSGVWKSLFKANQNMKKKPMAVDLNPKAGTNDELFGIINPATREWKDGEFTALKGRVSLCCHPRSLNTMSSIAQLAFVHVCA